MSAKPTPCSFFDTPEGRWTLLSEFTTEEAANQFHPHIPRDLNADDLSLGANAHHHETHQNTVQPPTPTPTATPTSSLRFGSAGSAGMAASGSIMFGDTRIQQQQQQQQQQLGNGNFGFAGPS
ncbi:hypothetical protein GGF37_004407, partial [Kickxella alabastrina]